MEEAKILHQFKNNSFFEKISYVLISLLVFLVPLFFIPKNFLSLQYGSSVLVFSAIVLAFVFWILNALISGKISIFSYTKKGLIIFTLIPIVYILSFIFKNFSRSAFLGYTFDITTVGFVFIIFVFMFLVSILFSSKEKIFYGYLSLIFSSIIVGLFIVSRMIFGSDFLSFGIFSGSVTTNVIGSWNNVSVFFGISAILSLISYQMLKLSKFMRNLVLISLFISLFFIILVNFKMTWIALSVVVFMFAVYKLYIDKAKTSSFGFKNISKFSLAIILISLIFIAFSLPLNNLIFKVFKIGNIDVRPNLSVTYDIAKNIIKESPLLGSGPNTFALNWLSNKPDDINRTIFWNTDFSFGVGLLPTIILTTGILGFLSWLVFFLVYLYIGFKIIFSVREDHFSNYIGTSSFLISLFLWIMAFMYIPSIPLFVLTVFFTGLTIAYYNITGEHIRNFVFNLDPKKGFIYSFSIVFVLVLSLSFGVAFVNNSMSLWNFQKALAYSSTDLNQAEIYVDKALSKVSYDIYFRAKADLANAKIQTLLSQDLSKSNVEDARNIFLSELSKSIDYSIKAKDANTKNYLNWISLARSYQIAVPKQIRIDGAYENSLNAYNEALKINPKNPAIYMLMARLELDNGNNQKAKENLVKSINLKQNYLDAYFSLAQIQISEGDIKEAINVVSSATLIEPNNQGLFFQLGLLQYGNNDFKSAINSFSKSISISPEYANAKYFLGLSLYKTGNTYDAIKQFEDILLTNPNNPEVMSILNNLKAGRDPFYSSKSSEQPEKRKDLPVR